MLMMFVSLGRLSWAVSGRAGGVSFLLVLFCCLLLWSALVLVLVPVVGLCSCDGWQVAGLGAMG